MIAMLIVIVVGEGNTSSRVNASNGSADGGV